jgi:hypothetical protein
VWKRSEAGQQNDKLHPPRWAAVNPNVQRRKNRVRACTQTSPSRVRFRANRTLSRHRRMTECDPKQNSPRAAVWCRCRLCEPFANSRSNLPWRPGGSQRGPPVVPPRLGCGASGVTLHSRATFSFRLRGLRPDVIDDLVCNPTQRRVRLGGRESAQGARRV